MELSIESITMRIHKVNIHSTCGVWIPPQPKVLPVPPSAPTKRHNETQGVVKGPVSSAKDCGDR
ncbi:hypothetical protein NC652_030396 [Populus alba x Populus x berolinensis]|nr:hypothetical protein NC652_030396 [Populus alba x Populus x berolinensis]